MCFHRSRPVACLLLTLLMAGLLSTGMVAAAQDTPGRPGTLQAGGGIFLSKLSAILGVEQSKLENAIKTAGKQTLDEMVKNGQITQKQADRLLQGIQNNPSHGFPSKGAFLEKKFFKCTKEDLAKALGMSVDELKAQLQDGKELSEVAKARGITMEKLHHKIFEQVKARITEAVDNGDITRQQAEEMINRLNLKKGEKHRSNR